jgi:alpha-ketoglutarate-dependent taurine dioxygenase
MIRMAPKAAVEAGQIEDLKRFLVADGLVTFSGVRTRDQLLATAAAVMRVTPHPHSDPDGVTTVRDRGAAGDRPGGAGFSRRALLPHTDRSGVADPPALVMTVVARAAGSGGACVLVDGKAVHEELGLEALAALSAPRTALFGGLGGHLGSVLTESRTSAAPSVVARRMLRLRLDELALFTPGTAVWLPLLRTVIDRHAVTVTLADGDGYLLDNHRWLHGRTAYIGDRIMHRLLGTPLASLGMWPGIPVPPGQPSRR